MPSERTPPPPFKAPSRARVLRIRGRLRSVYGIPAMAPHGHPIAELVLTVLSQSTNDRNRDVAYLRMRDRFGSWEAVRDAPTAELELHVNLLRHGRRTCHARLPACERCALARMCPSARVLGRARQPRGSTAKAITA